MRFGFCTTDPEVLPMLQKYGYRCFEADFQLIREMSDGEFKKLYDAVEETGVRMAGMNCFAHPEHKILADSHEEIDAYFESGVKRGKSLGLEYIVIGSGGARKPPEGMSHEEGTERLTAMLRRFCVIAERYGVEVYLEPLRYEETNMINTLSEAAEICRRVDHPRLRCVVDFYHMTSVNEPFSDVIADKDYVKHIHVATADRRVPLLADGEEVRDMARTLHAIGYDEYIVLEGAASPDLDTALSEFNKWFTAFEEVG